MTDWIFVFEPRRPVGIFRFLRVGFGHCYAFKQQKGIWQKLDPMHYDQPFLDQIPIDPLHIMSAMAACGASVAYAKGLRANDEPKIQFRPLTCVELLKRYIGQDELKIQTPWQMFKWIVNREAFQGNQPHFAMEKNSHPPCDIE